jgi:hypothetical protein
MRGAFFGTDSLLVISIIDSLLGISEGRNKLGVSFHSPEARDRSSFRNFVFSSYLEFLTMDKVHCGSPWSEPFIVYDN